MNGKRALGIIAIGWATSVGADPVEVEITDRAIEGKGLPSVHLHINDPIARYELRLQRSDGEDFSFTGSGSPGADRVISLRQPVGTFHYLGELTVNFPNSEKSSMPMQFDAEVIGPLQISIEPADLDLAQRRLRFLLSRPAEKGHITVLMDTGEVAIDADVRFPGEGPGVPLEVTWPASAGDVLKISLKVYDTEGFFTGVELYPWQRVMTLEPPVFDGGKGGLRREARDDLDRIYRTATEVAGTIGSAVPLKLYVLWPNKGDRADEAGKVALQRARTLGLSLRRRGLRIPILFGVTGEEDGGSDPSRSDQGQRAKCVLSAGDPNPLEGPGGPTWHRL